MVYFFIYVVVYQPSSYTELLSIGIIIRLGTSNEILNSISFENNANGATSGIGADYSGIIQILGTFGVKLIGTMIIICSIVINLVVLWINFNFYKNY